jgi:hypothetical protein
MRKILWALIILLCSVGVVEAQVTQGTVFSKTEDGSGNHIGSTVSGPDRGLNVFCIGASCTGAGGATYLDADGIANQTASAVHGQTYMYNGVTWDRVRGTIAGGLQVNCITGCAGSSFLDSAAFTFGVTTINNMGAVVDDVGTNTVAENSAGTPRMNTNRIMYGMPTNLTGTALYPTAVVEADAIANPTLTQISEFMHGYNGATWDRLRSSIANGLVVDTELPAAVALSDALANPTTPLIGGVTLGFNGATFERVRTQGDSTDAVATEACCHLATANHGYMFNGATWDRVRGTIAGGLLSNVSNAFLLDATFTGRINTLGQKAMAASTPVVLASDQTSIPVAATVSNAFLLDATFTGRFAAAYVDADTIANQTTTAVHGQLYGFNGATWDRLRSTIAGGLLVDVSDLFLLDATLTNRFPAGSTPANGESNAVTISRIGTFNYVFNGASWDRWTGAVAQSGFWQVTVTGLKTNNSGVPGANNLGVLPCIANAAAPVYIEGSQTLCSQNLSGAQRVIEQNFIATANNDGSCASGAVSFTAIASNASRTWLAVWASPANTDDVYLKLGAVATNADARFAPGQPLNFTSGRIYTGIIDAFPNSGTQAVCVMELN